jgi:hypothetical protein
MRWHKCFATKLLRPAYIFYNVVTYLRVKIVVCYQKTRFVIVVSTQQFCRLRIRTTEIKPDINILLKQKHCQMSK